MNFRQRLNTLINHKVTVNTIPGSGDNEDNGIPSGAIREVGDDYVMIQVKTETELGVPREGGDWFMPIQHIVSIIHMVHECSGCGGIDLTEIRKRVLRYE